MHEAATTGSRWVLGPQNMRLIVMEYTEQHVRIIVSQPRKKRHKPMHVVNQPRRLNSAITSGHPYSMQLNPVPPIKKMLAMLLKSKKEIMYPRVLVSETNNRSD
jgi:hypothetical protein